VCSGSAPRTWKCWKQVSQKPSPQRSHMRDVTYAYNITLQHPMQSMTYLARSSQNTVHAESRVLYNTPLTTSACSCKSARGAHLKFALDAHVDRHVLVQPRQLRVRRVARPAEGGRARDAPHLRDFCRARGARELVLAGRRRERDAGAAVVLKEEARPQPGRLARHDILRGSARASPRERRYTHV
jgi:hypothetical protein